MDFNYYHYFHTQKFVCDRQIFKIIPNITEYWMFQHSFICKIFTCTLTCLNVANSQTVNSKELPSLCTVWRQYNNGLHCSLCAVQTLGGDRICHSTLVHVFHTFYKLTIQSSKFQLFFEFSPLSHCIWFAQ